MRRRILVVDDEPGMIRAVRRILRKSYEVACASAREEALSLLEEFRPDLAVLDIRMPDTDGFELMAEIKERQPDVDVILMTGSVTEFDRKLIRAIRQKAFYFIQKPFDREVPLALVERCLELRRLSQLEHRHTQHLEAELEHARSFQRSLLPPSSAEFGPLHLEARYIPCDELSGDLYTYAKAPDGKVSLLVADVSGHGASAAMLTGFVKSAFHASWAEGFEPKVVVESLAAGMRGLMGNRFVTLFCCRIDSESHSLEYVNAGHPPGLLRRSGEIHQLSSTAMLISPVLPNPLIRQETMAFEPEDLLLLYTDGVIEAHGDQGELGVERLEEAVLQAPRGGCLDAVIALVDQHRQGRRLEDDLTLLGVDFRARP